MAKLAKILISEGIIKKKILRVSRLWIGRQKEPILGYVRKTTKKKESRQ